MADKISPAARSRNMSAIGGKDTKPELVVRKALFSAGFRYRLHLRNLPGTPDIVLAKHNSVVFVHGCFWHAHHGCSDFRLPSSNRAFWKKKLNGNVKRDLLARQALLATGWRVMCVWECTLKTDKLRNASARGLTSWILGSRKSGELPTRPVARKQAK